MEVLLDLVWRSTDHEGHSAAPPQPKLGISPAKTPRPQRSEKMLKRIRKNIYLSSPNLAPLRLGGSNFRLRVLFNFQIICVGRANFEL